MTIETGFIDNGPDQAHYLYAYDRERDVAAIDYGGPYVDITVAGTWQPGKAIEDAEAFDVVNVWDNVTKHDRRSPDHPFTLEHLVQLARPHFGRDA